MNRVWLRPGWLSLVALAFLLALAALLANSLLRRPALHSRDRLEMDHQRQRPRHPARLDSLQSLQAQVRLILHFFTNVGSAQIA